MMIADVINGNELADAYGREIIIGMDYRNIDGAQ